MPRPLRILLADDHPLLREGVAHALEGEPGWLVVAQSENGEQAIEHALRLQPDLALIDLSMPGIGGIAAVGRIATACPAARIIVLTASCETDALMAALKAGAHGYVLKGVSALEMRNAVRRVVAGEAYVTSSLAAQMLVEFSRGQPAPVEQQLTAREAEALNYLAKGLTNREIGAKLHVAEKTVKHHLTQIFTKLHVRSRTEAALLVHRRGRRDL